MTRIHSRLLGTVGLTASAALLTGCAVLGGDAGSAGIVSDDDLSTSYGLVQPGVLTVCSDVPYPPFEFEENGELTGYDIQLVEAVAEKLGLGVNAVSYTHLTLPTSDLV